MRNLFTTIALLFLGFVFMSTAQAQRLGNIRTTHEPLRPFVWTDGVVRLASVASPALQVPGYYEMTFTTDVRIEATDGWLIETVLPNAFALSTSAKSSEPGSWLGEVSARIPAICSVGVRQSFVTVTVSLRHGSESRQVIVPVDHACLIGDSSQNTPGLTALIAPEDPAISEIVQSITSEDMNGGIESVHAALAEFLASHGARYRQDPVVPAGMIEAEHYALAPSETLRYGGDCEDWAIVFASVLVRVGLRAQVVDTGTHAFATVDTGGGTYVFDIDLHGVVVEQPLNLKALVRE